MKPCTIAAALAAILSALPAGAASIDLAALGLVRGTSLAQSDAVTVSIDLALDTFLADVADAGFSGTVLATPSAATGFLGLFEPFAFDGDLVAFDVDAASAAGLFRDGATYVLAEVTLPTGLAFADGLVVTDASARLYAVAAVAAVPLPAAGSLMLAACGALALLRRRSSAA